MINCENPLSTYQWFHMSCLRMKKVPKTWFCPRCHSIKKQTTKTDNLYSNYCMMYIVVFYHVFIVCTCVHITILIQQIIKHICLLFISSKIKCY